MHCLELERIKFKGTNSIRNITTIVAFKAYEINKVWKTTEYSTEKKRSPRAKLIDREKLLKLPFVFICHFFIECILVFDIGQVS